MSLSLSGALAAPFTLKGNPVPSPALIAGTVTQAATIADTNETDLAAWTIPGGLLDIDGRGLRLTAFGSFAANANNKRVRAYFGSVTLADTAAIAANGVNWLVEVVMFRTGASAQLFRNRMQHGTTLIALGLGTGAISNAADQLLRVTGLNGTASANDIVLRGAHVELL